MQAPLLPWHGYIPTPLDPPETPDDSNLSRLLSDPPPPDIGLCDGFRHSGWQKTRQKIYDAMMALPVSYGRRNAFDAVR